MPLKTQERIHCDVLIIGGGGAGLRAAIAAASSRADVMMVSKTRIGHATNTYLSKAIIASSGYGNIHDNSRVHTRDTLQGGRHLNNPAMVARFTEAIPSEAALLREWGVNFSLDKNGRPAILKIPGHSHARHLYGSNWKGSDLVLPLKQKAMEKGVRFLEHTFVSSLVVLGSRICGATGISQEGTFLAIKAKTVVLATGGFGQVFLNTNNAPGITGDGHALAFDVGISLQDMEFVQFYPTALGKHGNRILLYERLLEQKTVVLKNSRGDDILKKNGYTEPKEITRDQLAQIIMKEIRDDPEQRGTIGMDLGGLMPDAVKALSMLLPAQFSSGNKVFQVAPTTHFCMGGIHIETQGETSITGLFAAGEVTAGSHGANRLGGNALAEVIAMGALVGKTAADRAMTMEPVSGFHKAATHEKIGLDKLFRDQGLMPKNLIRELKEIMWFNAGIVRDRQSLDTALKTVMDQKDVQALVSTPKDLIRFLEFRNMRLVAELICRSALERTESRGSHFRKDYPEENDQAWLRNIQVTKTGSRISLRQVPVSRENLPLS